MSASAKALVVVCEYFSCYMISIEICNCVTFVICLFEGEGKSSNAAESFGNGERRELGMLAMRKLLLL